MRTTKNRFVPGLLLLAAGMIAQQSFVQSTPPKSVSEKEVLPVRRVAPIYPDDARQAKVQGVVKLDIVIAVDGSVKSLKVVQGAPSLVPAAADAVRQWRYKPYLLNGKSTEVATTVTVTFSLDASVVETLPCGDTIPPAANSSETYESPGPQGGGSFQQAKTHFVAANTALLEAKQIESQLKSRTSADRDQLRAKFGSACGTALTEFRLADNLTGPNEKINHSLILANLASTYALAARHKDAAATYQLAIAWKPSSGLYANMSIELGKEEQFADASAACDTAISLDTNAADTCWRNLGIVFYNASRFTEAIGPLQRASVSGPQNAMGWYLLGDSLRRTSEPDKTKAKATEAFQRCLQLDSAGPYAERARMALREMHVPVSAP